MSNLISAKEAAKYLLSLDSPEVGDLMSNLKLQKLLYYAQGVHLALYDFPLFKENIEAWLNGPVCPDVYHEYKNCGSNSIPQPIGFDPKHLSEDIQETLNEVHTVYGQFSAWRLREMTHAEPPWQDFYKEGESVVIPHSAMKRYFDTLIE